MIVEDYQENYGNGFVKSYRSTMYKGWYKKSEYFHLWHHLLYRANHKGCELMFNGENIKLNPGQFITGRKKLSEETGIHESKIERILNFFEIKEKQIEQQKTNKNRLISIVNWHLYQHTEQQANNKRTTNEQQVNTNKNEKKEKNINIPSFSDFEIYALAHEPQLNLKSLELKYKAWCESGWKDGNGKPIKNWKSKLLNTIPYLQKNNGESTPTKIYKQ